MKIKFKTIAYYRSSFHLCKKHFSAKQDIGIEALECNHPIYYSYPTTSIQLSCNY